VHSTILAARNAIGNRKGLTVLTEEFGAGVCQPKERVIRMVVPQNGVLRSRKPVGA